MKIDEQIGAENKKRCYKITHGLIRKLVTIHDMAKEICMSLLDRIKDVFEKEGGDLKTYSPLSYAYIGDCVYDLIIRTLVIENGNMPANMLNKKTVSYVNAGAQAKVYDELITGDILSEEEADMLRRGRNAKSYTKAKNASVSDYRKATAVEALVGYLYLANREERLLEIMKYAVGILET